MSYQYDACPGGLGKLCQLTDESGTTDYPYDAFGNLTQSTRTTRGLPILRATPTTTT